MLDELYMQRCIDLAQKGRGKTGLNPLVGAVIVYDKKIIGEGWHKGFGLPHAEPDAIAGVRLENQQYLEQSTLYVSLEPCSHYGKTPPCVDLILRNRIPRVVIGTVDPNPQVNGRGIQKLKAAGIDVQSGILSQQTDDLIKVFRTNQLQKRPFVTIKFARSKDGFIGQQGKEIRISDNVSDFITHRLRTEVSGIAVGRNTADTDHPQLTARKYPGKNPLRIIFVSQKTPKFNSFTFDQSAPTLIVGPANLKPTTLSTATMWMDAEKTMDKTLRKLYQQLKVHHLLVEGGQQLINSFLKENLWDEIYEIESSANIHGGIPAPKTDGFELVNLFLLRADKLNLYRSQQIS